jgi:hypothetical protein
LQHGRACISIPAVLRHRCGLRPGDRVLLAAIPAQDTLAARTVHNAASTRQIGLWPPYRDDTAPGVAPCSVTTWPSSGQRDCLLDSSSSYFLLAIHTFCTFQIGH